MKTCPEDVVIVGDLLRANDSHELYDIAKRLIPTICSNNCTSDVEVVKMWESLERRKQGSDQLWVWGFLEIINNLLNLEDHHFLGRVERDELSERIASKAKSLIRDLERHNLDCSVIYSDDPIFQGWYFSEDFGEKNQKKIIEAGTKKIKASEVINAICERSTLALKSSSLKGKVGKNSKAIKFIRLLADRNILLYGTPLNSVIATVTNVFFETNYYESDIRKLLSR